MDEKLARLTDDELSDVEQKNNGGKIMEEENGTGREIKEEPNDEDVDDDEDEDEDEDDLPTGNC